MSRHRVERCPGYKGCCYDSTPLEEKRKRIWHISGIYWSIHILRGDHIFLHLYFFRDDYNEKQRLTRFYGYLFAEKISRQLYDLSTDLIPLYTLASVDSWSIKDFNTTAQEIAKSRPEIMTINFAPNGVVSHVFPYEENKIALGHDLLKDEERRKEAELAKDTQKITLSGPFHLRQGGVGLAFRQPIYFPSDERKNDFWGFAVIIYRFPDILPALPGLPPASSSGHFPGYSRTDVSPQW